MSEEQGVVTCDLEGRIETFSPGAAELFGYTPDELIGRKRISILSPGKVVLGHLGTWLQTASVEGSFATQSVLRRKDGSQFAAEIHITPTFEDGRQIGFREVTTPRPELSVDEAMPPTSIKTRIIAGVAIARAPFLTASMVPILLAAAASIRAGGWSQFSWGLFALTLVGGVALHLGANILNDYFDTRSGADDANNDYFAPLSGGSRAVEMGLITERGLLIAGLVPLAVALAAGVVAALVSTSQVWLFGLAGAFGGYFYTAPPLRLIARKGLGELCIGLCFGPLIVAGARAVLDRGLTASSLTESLLLGAVLGLLTTAILWINEFPDEAGDRAAGKNNLVVVLGRRAARWGFLALLSAAPVLLLVSALLGLVPMGALLGLLIAPLGVFAVRVAFRHYDDRQLIAANQATVKLQLVAGLLMAVGLLVL